MSDRDRATADGSGAQSAGRITLAHEAPFRLGALTLEPALRRVSRADGRDEVVEPRVMQVLVTLARAEGRIISRDDLLAACWHGVVVGEDAINRAIGKLRRLVDGIGDGEFKLETITKVGYRLVPTSGATPALAPPPSPPAAMDAPAAAAPLPAKPSIAVLPFTNLSGDPQQDYFADGMVEEIITALSRIRSIFVIASGSSLSFRGDQVDPFDAARRLGVRYVLEGSVRRAANRVRIAVKLIDAVDRGQIWADRFEEEMQDVFDLQDRVAIAVAGVIEPRVQHAEMRRAAGPQLDRLTAYDLYLRALALYRTSQPAATLEALGLLERAISDVPDYGLALGLAAVCHRDIALNGWSSDSDGHRASAITCAERALRTGGDDAEVLSFAGAALGPLESDIAAVISIFDRAISLNPGSSTAWLSSGMMRLRAGEPALAAEHFETSMRLDPLSPLRGRQLFGLGSARFEQERFADAAALLTESVRLLPMAQTSALLAAAHGWLGQEAEGKAALQSCTALGGGDGRELAATAPNARQRRLLEEGLARLAAA